MKKVININFQGQVIAIEETAYEILNRYIDSLQSYFSKEEGGDEIVNDIECRIAELFGNRLKHGINCITDEDVEAIITSIGLPKDFDMDYEEHEERQAPRSTSSAGIYRHPLKMSRNTARSIGIPTTESLGVFAADWRTISKPTRYGSGFSSYSSSEYSSGCILCCGLY